MKKTLSFLLVTLILTTISAYAQDNSKGKLTNQPDSLSYSFGLLIGNNLQMQKVKDLNMEIFMQGLKDGFNKADSQIAIEDANLFIQKYFDQQMTQEAQDNQQKCAKFLDENKTKEGVVTLASGLQYKILQKGEGTPPSASDTVTVNYTGTLIDGTMFDSSVERGKPATFAVNQVIPGWTEALQLMKPGSIWILYIPADLAYGDKGAGGVIGPNEALIFQVELMSVQKAK